MCTMNLHKNLSSRKDLHFQKLTFSKAINEIIQGLQRTVSVRRPLTKRKVESPHLRDFQQTLKEQKVCNFLSCLKSTFLLSLSL